MRLTVVCDPQDSASGQAILVQDASGNTKWVVKILPGSRGLTIDLQGKRESSSKIIIRRGLLSDTATFITLSGDLVTVRHNRGKIPVFAGNDWVIRGTGYPEEFYIDAGYGKLATIHRTKPSETTQELSLISATDPRRFLGFCIDCSLTAIASDVVCGVFAVIAIQDHK